MAKMHKRHTLEGFSGEVGTHLRVEHKADGRKQVHAHHRPGKSESQWEFFKEAIAYAFKAEQDPAYQHEAEVRHSNPFRVATADFLHAPDITRLDVTDYHGHVDDTIRIDVHDITVTQVGVLIVDEENHLLEMGLAKQQGANWVYRATHEVQHHHVRIVVDAADLPGHLSEARTETEV
jgi:hypothetical protein